MPTYCTGQEDTVGDEGADSDDLHDNVGREIVQPLMDFEARNESVDLARGQGKVQTVPLKRGGGREGGDIESSGHTKVQSMVWSAVI